MAPKAHWLVKSEPEVYSIARLEKEGSTCWDGVRNYQARNFMQAMALGDPVLFYHSNAEPPGVAGIARVCRLAYPDPSAWDPTSPYFDETATAEQPRWFMVDLEFVSAFPAIVGLDVLKADPALVGMEVVRKGSRLSVQSVSAEHFARVVQLGRGAAKKKAPAKKKAKG